jgi:hypothetical protein
LKKPTILRYCGCLPPSLTTVFHITFFFDSSLQALKSSHKFQNANKRSESSEVCGSINILYVRGQVSVIVLSIYRFLPLCHPSNSYEDTVHTMSTLTLRSWTAHRYEKHALPICVITTNKIHFFSYFSG